MIGTLILTKLYPAPAEPIRRAYFTKNLGRD